MLLLLAIPLVLLWLLFAAHRDRIGFGNLSIRGAFVLAYLAFEVLLLAITEVTSIGHHFTAWTVAIAWIVVIVLLLLAATPQIAGRARRIRSGRGGGLGIRNRLRPLSTEDRIWIVVVLLILATLAAVGSIYPPSNTDSLVYHLARVEHWVQNRSVAPFATHYLAQIELAPLAEYNLAHLHLLSGTDRFDWSVQWLAALVSIVGVSELARLLGATLRTQIAASVICATIPSGILLATSTENDYFAAAVGIGLLVVLTGFSFGDRWGYRAAAVGAAAGLAYMAKGTMPVMLGPVALVLLSIAGYRHVRSKGWDATYGRAIALGLAVSAGAIVVAGPFALKNTQLFGSTIGPTSRSTISAPISLGPFMANIVRSTASNFDVGNGVSGLDTYLSMAVLGVSHHIYSIFGISPTDARFAVGPNTNTFAVTDYSFAQRTESLASNPWQVLLIGVAFVVLAIGVRRGLKELRVTLALALALASGYLLFSGVARWSPYNVRYGLPLLVAFSAIVAIALARFPRWVLRFVLIGLVIASLPQLLDNAVQPLVHPKVLSGPYLSPYFAENTVFHPPAEEASAYATITSVLAQSTCRQAALANWVLFEYPLWVALRHDQWPGTLNDFDVHNQSARYEPTYRPCAWISQQGDRYVTPRNGTTTVQVNDLAISMAPTDAVSVHTVVPSCSSSVRGAQVFPGGGWSLTALGHDPLLGGRGSLYLVSESAQRVQLQLHMAPSVDQPSPIVTVPGGRDLPSTLERHVTLVDVNLRRGSNRIDLTAGLSRSTKKRILVLTAMSLGPPGA